MFRCSISREQPGVVDGDGGLVGERLQQRDLVVVETAGVEPGECDHAEEDTVADHRYTQHTAATGAASGGVREAVGELIEVGDVHGRRRDCGLAGRRTRIDRDAVEEFARVVHAAGGAQDQLVTVFDEDPGAGSRAQAVGVVCNCVEDRLHVETRRADGVEHLGHGCLAFQRCVEVVEQLGIGDCDDCLLGERLQRGCVVIVERANLVAYDVEIADPLRL